MQLEKIRTRIAWLHLAAVITMFSLIAFFKMIEFYDSDTTQIAVAGTLFITGEKSIEILKFFRKHRHHKATTETANRNYSYSSFLVVIFYICIPLAILTLQGIKPFSLKAFSDFLLVAKIIFATYANPLVNELLGLIDTIEKKADTIDIIHPHPNP
jgi:uncharacterized membrane protein